MENRTGGDGSFGSVGRSVLNVDAVVGYRRRVFVERAREESAGMEKRRTNPTEGAVFLLGSSSWEGVRWAMERVGVWSV